MIIFGWGHQKIKNLGPLFTAKCEHCRNTVSFDVADISVWFTLFFAPVFPYKRDRMLLCPVCSYGFPLNELQFQTAKRHVDLYNLYRGGEITEEEFQMRLQEIQHLEGKNGIELEQNSSVENIPKRKPRKDYDSHSYCPRCQAQYRKGFDTCSDCNIPLVEFGWTPDI